MVKNPDNLQRKPEGYLPLIIPVAFALMILLVAGRIFVPLALVGGAVFGWRKYWQNQQKKLEQLNNTFYQLILENKGWITALDLAMKSNISGVQVQKYLEERAREFAAHYEVTEQGGMIYYFDSVFIPNGNPQPTIVDTNSEAVKKVDDPVSKQPEKPPEIIEVVREENSPKIEPISPVTPQKKEIKLPPLQADKIDSKSAHKSQPPVSFDIKENPTPPAPITAINKPASAKIIVPKSLSQTELAYRLGVHATTVSKWKSRSDFSEWSQTKDPGKIAWKYDPKSKRFDQINND